LTEICKYKTTKKATNRQNSKLKYKTL